MHAALELYAEAFDSVGQLDRLEAFASFNGADFYGLPRNPDRIALKRSAQRIPLDIPFGDERLVPLRAGEEIAFTIAN